MCVKLPERAVAKGRKEIMLSAEYSLLLYIPKNLAIRFTGAIKK